MEICFSVQRQPKLFEPDVLSVTMYQYSLELRVPIPIGGMKNYVHSLMIYSILVEYGVSGNKQN